MMKSYQVIKVWEVRIVKEVMVCDVSPVAMFLHRACKVTNVTSGASCGAKNKLDIFALSEEEMPAEAGI